MLDPHHPITYGDSDDGRLLQSVLDKNHIQAALDSYQQRLLGRSREENLPHLFELLAGPYTEAFFVQPLRYENEFLDVF